MFQGLVCGMCLNMCCFLKVYMMHNTNVQTGIICANLLYGKLLKRCYGIEIVPELYASSVTVLEKFRKNILCVGGGATGSNEGGEDGNNCLYSAHRACEMQVALGDITAEEFIADWASAGVHVCCMLESY